MARKNYRLYNWEVLSSKKWTKGLGFLLVLLKITPSCACPWTALLDDFHAHYFFLYRQLARAQNKKKINKKEVEIEEDKNEARQIDFVL